MDTKGQQALYNKGKYKTESRQSQMGKENGDIRQLMDGESRLLYIREANGRKK